MFSTINYKSQKDKPLRWDHAFEPNGHSMNGTQHSACENCRNKKLKCTGQKPSCSRCSHGKIECKYPSPGRRNRKTDGSSSITQSENSSKKKSGSSSRKSEEAGSARSRSNDSKTHTANSSAPSSPPNLTASNSYSSDESGMPTSEKEVMSDFNQFNPMDILSPGSFPAGFSPSAGDGLPAGQLQDLDDFMNDLGIPSLAQGNDFDPFGSPRLDKLSLNMDMEPTIGISVQPASQSSGSKNPAFRDAFTIDDTQLDPMLSAFETTITTKSTPKIGCDCLHKASDTLRQWESSKNNADTAQIDTRLSWQRQAVQLCNEIFECQQCSPISSSMMLPLMMCEQLVTSFRAISQGRVDVESRFKQPYQNMDMFSSSLTLGEFEIQTAQEWQCCMGMIALYQLKQLDALIKRFRQRAETYAWQMQVTIAQSLEQRIEEIEVFARRPGLS